MFATMFIVCFEVHCVLCRGVIAKKDDAPSSLRVNPKIGPPFDSGGANGH